MVSGWADEGRGDAGKISIGSSLKGRDKRKLTGW